MKEPEVTSYAVHLAPSEVNLQHKCEATEMKTSTPKPEDMVLFWKASFRLG